MFALALKKIDLKCIILLKHIEVDHVLGLSEMLTLNTSCFVKLMCNF